MEHNTISHDVFETTLHDAMGNLVNAFKIACEKLGGARPGKAEEAAIKKAAFQSTSLLTAPVNKKKSESASKKGAEKTTDEADKINQLTWLWQVCTKVPRGSIEGDRYYQALNNILEQPSMKLNFYKAIGRAVMMAAAGHKWTCLGVTWIEKATMVLEEVLTTALTLFSIF